MPHDMHHPSTTSWGCFFPPPSRLPDWRCWRRPDSPRRCRPALPHLRGLDAPWAPRPTRREIDGPRRCKPALPHLRGLDAPWASRPTRGTHRPHEGRPATTQDTREKRDTHDKDEKIIICVMKKKIITPDPVVPIKEKTENHQNNNNDTRDFDDEICFEN